MADYNPKLTTEQIARFWAKVDRSGGPDACWPWTGSRTWTGHGAAYADGKTVGAHRLSLFLGQGPFPRSLCSLHSCDNPPCCNPAHLRPGTHAENRRDRTERTGYARLTHAQRRVVGRILAIRTYRHLSRAKLAAQIGVERSVVDEWETGDRVPSGAAVARLCALADDNGAALLAALAAPNT